MITRRQLLATFPGMCIASSALPQQEPLGESPQSEATGTIMPLNVLYYHLLERIRQLPNGHRGKFLRLSYSMGHRSDIHFHDWWMSQDLTVEMICPHGVRCALMFGYDPRKQGDDAAHDAEHMQQFFMLQDVPGHFGGPECPWECDKCKQEWNTES